MRAFGMATTIWAGLVGTATADDVEFFAKQVRPVLEKHCFSCHSHAANKAKGGLMLDSRAAIVKGGETGTSFDAKHPEKSLFLEAIRYTNDDLRMPPKGKMPEADVAVLEAWFRKGIPWAGEGAKVAKGGRVPGTITAEDRTWWAIQPIKPVAPPKAAHAGWDANPIDRFLSARLAKEGLTPAPAAERAALMRRVHFDLVGLPPTPEEVDAFVRDPDPKAYEKLVDRLLASPRHGERMARWWLDLVRYAESDGFRLDSYRPSAWRYRDYVVRAFNADMPYDRFVREQLAGDEANPTDADALVATGFLAAGIYEYNQRDVRTQWSDIVNEVTDVSADVFLALGMSCARCHDHKYDPILQKDYFRLRAYFEPIVVLQEAEAATPAQRAAFDAKQKVWLEKTAVVRAQIEAIEGPERKAIAKSAISKFPKDIQEAMNKGDGNRSPYEEQLHQLAFRQIAYEFDRLDTKIKGEKKDKLLDLRRELAKFDAFKPEPLPRAQLARDVGTTAPPTSFRKGETIAPGVPTILDPNDASVTPTGTSTGRRLALANWIVGPDNPLAARVLVNRLWQMHFGKGLAANASDFGRLGETPVHPELLDWLADRFVKDGWSLKKTHRTMVLSEAYRQSAVHPASEEHLRKDPENRFVWRGGVRRLEAEQIRDALLAVGGKLDLAPSGPSVEPREPRRSVFAKVQRNLRDPLLDVFDWPEGFQSTPQRNVTTTATQSLLLLNSGTMAQHAKNLADRVRKERTEPEAQVERLYSLLFGRAPLANERAAALAFLASQPSRIVPMAKSGPDVAKLPLREGKAVSLAPNEGPVRMSVDPGARIPRGDFTLEAYVLLRSTFEDGQVRTIASLWNGDMKSSGGWSFGVTSKKSAYKPQMLVLQLWGENANGKPQYEAVFSSLQLALNKPYYVAVSAKLSEVGENGIAFYARDLTNDEEPMQVYSTSHKVVKLLPAAGRFSLGGADGTLERSWDGLIDDARLSSVALKQEQLLPNAEAIRDDTVGFWQFEPTPGTLRDSSRNGLHLTRRSGPSSAAADAREAAFVDLCLVLLNANEFLYVD